MKPQGWEDRLSKYIEDKRYKPFKWGFNDCVIFTLKGVESIYEVSLLKTLGITWKSKKQAFTALKELSKSKNLLEASKPILKDIGFKEKNINFASRGDIIIYLSDNGWTFGLFNGSVVMTPGKDGLVFKKVSGFCFEYVGDNK